MSEPILYKSVEFRQVHDRWRLIVGKVLINFSHITYISLEEETLIVNYSSGVQTTIVDRDNKIRDSLLPMLIGTDIDGNEV